jgi:energy-coupling factor transporter transmembrane protein EcfT
MGSVVLIFLVFCVVVFGGRSVVLNFLVFCVMVFGGGSVVLPTKYYNTES